MLVVVVAASSMYSTGQMYSIVGRVRVGVGGQPLLSTLNSVGRLASSDYCPIHCCWHCSTSDAVMFVRVLVDIFSG